MLKCRRTSPLVLRDFHQSVSNKSYAFTIPITQSRQFSRFRFTVRNSSNKDDPNVDSTSSQLKQWFHNTNNHWRQKFNQRRSYHDHNKADWEKEWKGKPGGRQFNFGNITPAHILVALNVMVFLLMGDSTRLRNSFTISLKSLGEGKLHTLITHMFVHNTFGHLAINCFALYSLRQMNMLIGNRGFFQLYFLAGLLGAVAFLGQHSFEYVTAQSQMKKLYAYNSAVVGASAAIAGVFTYFALVAPQSRILLFFVVPVPALRAVQGFALFELFRLMFNVSPSVSASGHLGGMAGGLLYFLLLRRFRL